MGHHATDILPGRPVPPLPAVTNLEKASFDVLSLAAAIVRVGQWSKSGAAFRLT